MRLNFPSSFRMEFLHFSLAIIFMFKVTMFKVVCKQARGDFCLWLIENLTER